MDKFQNKYRIPSARKPGYDYSTNGSYFITICTKNREYYFGEIANGEMQLSEIGKIADQYWLEIPDHFPFVELDEYVVMPNHVHGIICINKKRDGMETVGTDNDKNVGTQNAGVDGTQNAGVVETQNIASLRETPNQPFKNNFGPQSQNLASIIRGYKTGVTTFAQQNIINFAWQPRFHDHIIRDDGELERIRKYIINNPKNWGNDENNK